MSQKCQSTRPDQETGIELSVICIVDTGSCICYFLRLGRTPLYLFHLILRSRRRALAKTISGRFLVSVTWNWMCRLWGLSEKTELVRLSKLRGQKWITKTNKCLEFAWRAFSGVMVTHSESQIRLKVIAQTRRRDDRWPYQLLRILSTCWSTG